MSSKGSRCKTDTWCNSINNTKSIDNNQYKKTCRVCLINPAQINIFNVSIMDDFVYTLLMQVSEIQIEKGDGLPTEICNKCLKNLKAAYQFKQQCESTDRVLRQKHNAFPSETTQQEIPPSIKVEDLQNVAQHFMILQTDPLNMDSESFTSTSNDSQLITTQTTTNTTFNFNTPKEESKPLETQSTPQQQQIVINLPINQQAVNGPQVIPTIIEQPIIKKSKARKNAVCAVCYQRFQEYEEYQAHVRTHNGEVEKPYKCKECGKGFLCVSQLNRHLYTHTDIKLYECSVCRKGFNNASHLKSHMYVHTGEKPYICKVCNKRFNQMPHLRRHMSSHEKEKDIMDLSTFPI